MSPNPITTEEPKKFSRISARCDDDEIVISGMAGSFPNSKNIAEYEYNLYNKIDMCDDADTRWKHFNTEIPKRCGKIPELEKFDANFFGMHFKQAHMMDPQCRKLIENAYEAIIDAGINPEDLNGTRTGVYVGVCISESEKTWFYEKISTGEFGITGCSRAMLANRLSYIFGLNGPSYIVDTACSSSMYALDNAFSALRSGEIDAAIIGGTNLTLHPFVTLQFARLGVLAKDGYCRPFDQEATGYTRSESVNCLLLQKKRDAKRVYATVVYSKTNCDGYKVEGITYPSGQMQEKLLSEFYKDCKISPTELGYLEAHSTGTIVGDPEECKAIDNTICKERTKPLLVGSVKSNIGHSEAASGICSLVKVILAFQNNKIAPNINFKSVRKEIPVLAEGRLKVVSEVENLPSDYVGVNSFGFGGANAHALLKGYEKRKINNGIPIDDLPRLVIWAGRTEEAVETILNSFTDKPLDAEYIALLQGVQNRTIRGLFFRGFGLYTKGPKNAECLVKEVQHFAGIKRPVIWIFSGTGSQWMEMGESMMKLTIFRDSIQKSHNLLQKKGINLINIITSRDLKIFENITNSLVAHAAIQIAFIDSLKLIGITPDALVGQSIGELACGYSDGGLSAEQMMFLALAIGQTFSEMEIRKGLMAVIEINSKKLQSIIPNTIDIAYHNNAESSTISGTFEDVFNFLSSLKENGISFKIIPNCSVPLHSRYIHNMRRNLLKKFNEIIPHPKQRSSKWLSTSILEKNCNDINNLCSAEYFTNNIMNKVLLEETLENLPSNSVTIEMSPNAFMQDILKKSMPNCHHVCLMEENSSMQDIQFFLHSLGRLFLDGIDMNLDKLYPKIDYPVSRGTPSIGSLIKWEHSDDWFVTKFENTKIDQSGERKFKVSLQEDDQDYLRGHTIDGKILVPATAYLQYVWETLSLMCIGPVYQNTAVEFEDVKFLRATHLTKDNTIYLTVMIHYASGKFEITESETLVVTGIVRELINPKPPMCLPLPEPSLYSTVESKDFYKELRLRGYHYNGDFRSVVEARGDGMIGKVKWNYNWVTFMDCLLQIHILGTDSRTLLLPTRIRKLRIDGKYHTSLLEKMPADHQVFDVQVSHKFERLISGGIEIIGLHASPVQRRKPPGIPVLEKYQFVSHFPTHRMEMNDAVRCCVQLALENVPSMQMKIVEVDLDNMTKPIINHFLDSIEDLPLISAEYLLLTKQDISLAGIQVEDTEIALQTNCSFVISNDILDNFKLVKNVEKSLNDISFLISKEKHDVNIDSIQAPPGFNIIAILLTHEESLILLQKIKKKYIGNPVAIKISNQDNNFKWLEIVQNQMSKSPVVLYAEKEKYNGLLGLVNCLRKEPEGNTVTCVIIDDLTAPPFSLEEPFYKNQLKLGMAINIYKNGKWGTYRHLKLILNIEEKPLAENAYGNVIHRGDLSSLCWFQGQSKKEDTTIQIVYASLNFRDVMLATGRLAVEIYGAGRLEQHCVLGFEFCGINLKTKKRVMGMVEKGGCSTFLTVAPKLWWEVPDHWSLEDAATMPCVYTTVYYAFFFAAKIERGKSVLIHAGTGGIGLSAIRVALAYGLEVFTTVSTDVKKQFLLNRYPQLKECNIGNSRDTSFERMIQEQTNGRGVDYVLNSLSEEKLLASVRCLGRGGHFLEIGKFDMANDNKLGLGEFVKEISFHSVLADNLFTNETELVKDLARLLQKDINNGIIQPLPAHVFEAHEIEKAFRFLASAKHMGKVLIKIRDDPYSALSLPIKMIPQIYFHPNLVYVIPGGLGGFGLELADWLAIRGARKIVLSSSRGVKKTYQAYRIALWKTYKVETIINTNDITTPEGCKALLKDAMRFGPIGGIFNLAVILRDALFTNQTSEKFIECMAPKAYATKYLDELSRVMCPQLEHFVIFSSVSCGRGNAGQTNYGMANSVMEKIIEDRVKHGYPGKAIQWGAVGEVGLVADMAEDKIDLEIGGTLQQRISSCLQELDSLLSTSDALVSSMVVAEKRAGRAGNENIIETVMNIMGIRDLKSVSMGSSLSEMGMDSLMAVEIKQTLERDFELFLTPQDLRSLTFQKLQEFSDAREKEGTDNKLKLNAASKLLGMNLLLRNLGDESTANEILFTLSTKQTKSNNMNPNIIIPGLEGVAGQAWYNIAKNLDSTYKLVQLNQTIEMERLEDVADSIHPIVENSLKNKSEPFHLIGYSFGSTITLELARRLEKSGRKGKILLIDGSPAFLKKLIHGHLGTQFTDEELYNTLLTSLVAQIFPEESQERVGFIFASLETIEDKLKKLVEYTDKQTLYSKQYGLNMVKAMINRIKMAHDMNMDEFESINSPILLLRPTDASVVDIDEDYELSKTTNGKVTLQFIDGNHSTMLDSEELTKIINDFVPKII